MSASQETDKSPQPDNVSPATAEDTPADPQRPPSPTDKATPPTAESPPDPQKRVQEAGRQNSKGDQWEWWRAGSPYIDTAQIGQIHIYQNSAHLYDRRADDAPHSTGLAVDEFLLINTVFVKPDDYDRAWAQLNQHHVAVLQGPPGIGKRASAVRLAIEFLGGYEEARTAVRELSPETDLRRWRQEATVEPETFYFIDGWMAARAAELNGFDWRSIARRLAERKSYLVICCPPNVSFAADVSGDAVVHWQAPGDARRLLHNHLRFYDVPADRATALLAQGEVERLLGARLSPGRLKLLAWRISRYHHEECPTLAAAVAGFAVHDDAGVAARFRQAADDRERAFQIALAVFSGARYREVQAAAERLAELLEASRPRPQPHQPAAEQPPAPETSLFDSLFDDPLARAQAVVETVLPSDGGAPIEIVRYTDEAYQPALLSFVWRRGIALRRPLLQWLREQGYSLFRDMRLRVAWATAFLAQLEYETVLRELLLPWAEQGERAELRLSRITLSYALGALVQSKSHTEAVLQLLRDWSMQTHSPQRAHAAVRAYIVVGQFYPREAMTQWRQVLHKWPFEMNFLVTEMLGIRIKDDTLRSLFDALIDAVLTFSLNALVLPRREFQRVYREILAALREWLEQDQDKQFLCSIALTLFLSLMHVRLEQTEADEPGRETPNPPALPVLVQEMNPSDPCLRDLAYLLSFAVRDERARDAALNSGLYHWVDYVETDRLLLPALELILKALAGEKQFNHPRWRREVGRRLEGWSTQRPRANRRPLPVAAHLVRAAGLQRN